MTRTCSIEGCNRKFLARGLCQRHYTQLRKHGDPLKRVLPERGSTLAFLKGLIGSMSDECISWPFRSKYVKGYGAVWFNGRLTGAHRVMCILAHGEPTAGFEAAHRCGNRACVNPNHLRWATASDNAADKIGHNTHSRGTRNPASKLSEADVEEIIRLKGTASQSVIAKKFGTTRENVRSIHNGQSWSWLTAKYRQPIAAE